MPTFPSDYLSELKKRLSNPAVPDAELITYLEEAMRDVSPAHYSAENYKSQLLDQACQLLLTDGKFPDINSISANGVTTNLSGGGENKFTKRLAARRVANFVNKGKV